MSYPDHFQGIAVHSHKDWLSPKTTVYPAKEFRPQDIDIEIEACGVCGSDIHCAEGNWGNQKLPLVVGHEVIGKVVRVGDECTTGLKIGDRVGVGAQVYSCLECERCKTDNEPYCTKFVTTYSQPYEDGYVSQGGYASHIRVHEHFAIPVPEEIPSELAAPLLCGGITVYSPLKRNGCGPGKKVGIVGIGGIGHMGILLAKAMGAEVYAISRGSNKREDALKLGADHFIATKEEEDWEKKNFDKLDLIVLCASSLSDVDFTKLPKLLKISGTLASISAPEASERLVLAPLQLVGFKITQSLLGSRAELLEMLDLVAKKNIKIWVETVPISEDGVSTVFNRMLKGDVRFRFTLTNFDEAFGEFKALK